MKDNNLPAHVAEVFAKDPRIVRVREYTDGFVPNAYKWPAPGYAAEWTRGGAEMRRVAYDRKRSNARGPWLVGYSERGGRLFSA